MILDSMLYKPCLDYLKKEPYTGSYQTMRYRLSKVILKNEETEEEKTFLGAWAYPDEFCFEVTSEENKEYKEFPFSADGIDQALDWLSKLQENYN